MKKVLSSVLTMAMCLTFVGSAFGEGLREGAPLAPYHVTKIAGAEADGIPAGKTLCYRCKYGSRPMVLVFANETNGKVAELVKQLDSAVAKHDSEQLKGVVTLLGKDKESLKDRGSKLAAKTGAKHVPIAYLKDESELRGYKLDPKAAVTVVVATDSQVVSSHATSADKIDVAGLMKEVSKVLN